MVFGSLNAMGIRRIEAGILDNLSDIDMSITPFQAGLGAFIDLKKSDFIGKAALLDADRRPLLYGLKCASATPDSQGEIMDNGICVGRVTVSERSPFLDCGIGYVRFDYADDWIGKTYPQGIGANRHLNGKRISAHPIHCLNRTG